MSKKTIKTELPENYEELKKAANRTASWKARYDAVVELGMYNHNQVKDILRTRLANDPVYKVQEAAFQSLLDFGEEAQLPKRKKFELVKGANKVFVRVKKSLPKDHTFEEYLTKLKRMRIDVYDTYEGDKGDEFKTWLEREWSNLK
ncbi:HEAT repeat domain-containing protein [Psychrobacillus psychrodurans]|uniref:HEAT repeat domain-containing protein n=1 Tax=Psychrobacillus psychrodurans TaxID=126157 RepID=A0A9X3L998_9BACI|nr:HEAT repeat domain-containing protein [Psychrobacillus psychrodurans]MCZ8531894.1 HEAT repeat domain-containing protein [Psychrobacillus psychrodurans]